MLAVGLALLVSVGDHACRSDEPDPDTATTAGHIVKPQAAVPSTGPRPPDAVRESDNWTFRATVLVRRGTSQGSGTIIASLDGETLVLTAAHVIRGRGPTTVELHRYNLGIERQPALPGLWPRKVPAETVISDGVSDLAILRLRNLITLPYVARLGRDEQEVAPDTGLVSVGIDLGTKLSSWKTRLVEVLWFELNDSGTDRPFLVTARIPEHGRSGGGLFDTEGTLVGVCVGHAELVKGRRMGVFSSVESLRQLLREHALLSIVEQSDARHARSALRYREPPGHRPARPAPSDVTTTGARQDPVLSRP